MPSKLVELLSLKIAPSKLIFTHFASGRFHLMMGGAKKIFVRERFARWNSYKKSRASELIDPNGDATSPTLHLFLQVQIIEVVIANRLDRSLFSRQS